VLTSEEMNHDLAVSRTKVGGNSENSNNQEESYWDSRGRGVSQGDEGRSSPQEYAGLRNRIQTSNSSKARTRPEKKNPQPTAEGFRSDSEC
jgi:hypothetical protein